MALGGGEACSHPKKAVLWLVDTGELGWGPGALTSCPRRTCILSPFPVDGNDPPVSVCAQHGPRRQARYAERHRSPWLRGP